MNATRLFRALLLLAALPLGASAQAPAPGEQRPPDRPVVEASTKKTPPMQLIQDDTRTKVGRDFYDLFYKFWGVSSLSTEPDEQASAAPTGAFEVVLIKIEELPSPGNAHQILIRIDDQPVWQEVVQGRYDALEQNAQDAVEEVRQYLAEQEIARRLLLQVSKGLGGR